MFQELRNDGQVINIEKSEDNKYWVVRYENDWDGDNTEYFKTLKKAKVTEQFIEDNQ